jgi:hypothetical protein
LKVIGAGFGRTGTLSLKAALERLGFVARYHMVEVSPPTREVGRRSLTGSRALKGRGRKLVVLLVLGGLLLYLLLPLAIESLLARRLQTAFGTPTKPDVEVSSNFPP